MFKLKKLAVAVAAAAVMPAYAVTYDVLALSFEGLALTNETVLIDQFYNAGTSKDLITGDPVNTGPAFGVVFGAAGQAMYGNGGDGPWTSRWPAVSDPAVDPPISGVGEGALFVEADTFTINVPAGFNNAFSLWYSGKGNLGTSSVKVYDGADGTGNEVGSFGLNSTGACDAAFGQACRWAVGATGLSATGRSVVFTIGGTQGTVFFDNMTFGARVPTDTSIEAPPIPEPGTYGLMALGLLGVVAAAKRRRA